MMYQRPVDLAAGHVAVDWASEPKDRNYRSFESGYWKGNSIFAESQEFSDIKRPHALDYYAWGMWMGWVDGRDAYTWQGAAIRAWHDFQNELAFNTPEPYDSCLDEAEFLYGYVIGNDGTPLRYGEIPAASAYAIGVQKGRLDKFRKCDRRGCIAIAYNEVVRYMSARGHEQYGHRSVLQHDAEYLKKRGMFDPFERLAATQPEAALHLQETTGSFYFNSPLEVA